MGVLGGWLTYSGSLVILLGSASVGNPNFPGNSGSG